MLAGTRSKLVVSAMSGSVGRRLHIALGIWIAICLVVVSCKKNEVSYGEYLEMKNYLEYINRPGVTTIETEDGDIFDCIDIYKQPALDHPALKNHVIQMEPASIPDGMNIVKPAESYIAMKTGLLDGGCPVGTVPIRRVQMEELLRAGSVSNLMNKYGNHGNSSNPPIIPHQFATATLSTQAGGSYKGTIVSINVWSPPLNFGLHRSRAQLWIVGGTGSNINTIEVGWQVFLNQYGGSDTHLVIYWTADNYNKTGCDNLLCPGFVQVSKTITPGMKLPKISQLDGNQEDITLLVFWDKVKQSWWLGYSDTPSGAFECVGYWPGSLFTNLNKGSSSRITWGGETVGDSFGSAPPMGSGQFPDQGYRRAAYMKQIKYIDSSGTTQNVPDNLHLSQSRPHCYKIEDKGWGSDEFGRYFFFGGPGGFCR